MGVPRPGGRQSGVAKRFGGRTGDTGALHHPNGEDQRGADPVSGKGLLPGNTFLAATDSALNDPQNAPRCRIISSARPAPSAGPTPISTATAKRWGDHPLPGGDRPRAVCQPPVAVAAAGRGNGGPAAGNGGLYLANGLIRTRLDVKPTFDRRFSVPAAEVTP